MIAPKRLSGAFYAELVGLIYESALNRARWQDVLDALESIYPDGRTTLFAHRDGRPIDGMTLQRNFDAADLKAYVDYYVSNSPYVQYASRLTVGLPVYSEECVSIRDLVVTEHYNDFIRPRRIGYHATGVLLERRPDGITSLSISDGKNNPRRRAHQKRLLGVISPHVMRALGLSHATARQQAATTATQAAFNRWADAAFVLDADAHLVTMNDAAAELLGGSDCISLDRSGALKSFDDNVSALLDAAVRRCLDIRGKLDLVTCDADRNGIVLPRRASAPPLHAMVWPLAFVDEQPEFGGRGRVLVMIFDPQRPHRTGVGWLGRRFKLAASEVALVSALVNGQTLTEAAEQLGIQLSTARTRLKTIQFKTGCNRQVDLLRLALSPPAIRQD